MTTPKKSWTPEDIKYVNDNMAEATSAGIGVALDRGKGSIDYMRGLLKNQGLEWVLSRNAKASTPGHMEVDTIAGINRAQLVNYLKGQQRSSLDIATRFDKSPASAEAAVLILEETHNIIRSERQVMLSTTEKPKIDFNPNFTLADFGTGLELNIAIDSDLHSGGTQSQPSALNRFMEIAYEDYGCRVFLKPGDLTQGIYTYRGWQEDIVPMSRPMNKGQSYWTSKFQKELADIYYGEPKSDVKHFLIGGNHDWKHVVTNGYDPVSTLCDERDDFTFLGYDVGSIPLTDKVHIRLWHPQGGAAYAKSYRLQKGQETQSLEAMKKAMAEAGDLMTSILVVGHLHFALAVPSLPMAGVHPGCFCAKTNYEKRKGLEPDLMGAILKLRIADNGRVQRMGVDFIPFDEIEDDWKSWPVPDFGPPPRSPDEIEPLFAIE